MNTAAHTPSQKPLQALEIALITGMSGSGKSVALNVFEDAGYYCVDNLPPELLPAFVDLLQNRANKRVAIAMDVRSATALPQLPALLDGLQAQGVRLRKIFLDAHTDTLVHRYSETRRRHPLSSPHTQNEEPRRILEQAIALERELLAELRTQSHIIDTSLIRAAQLRTIIKGLIEAPASQLTLVFESFAFKRGIPLNADFVFDVRMLPNPHYEPTLQPLTGRDAAVIRFLQQAEPVSQMQTHITQFLAYWLPPLLHDHRSYVTVAIGCTGGQHRSVYLVEQLAAHFSAHWVCLKRHRELDGSNA